MRKEKKQKNLNNDDIWGRTKLCLMGSSVMCIGAMILFAMNFLYGEKVSIYAIAYFVFIPLLTASNFLFKNIKVLHAATILAIGGFAIAFIQLLKNWQLL